MRRREPTQPLGAQEDQGSQIDDVLSPCFAPAAPAATALWIFLLLLLLLFYLYISNFKS